MAVTAKEIDAVVDKVQYMPWQSNSDPSIDPTVYAEDVEEEVRKLFERARVEGFQEQ